MTDVKELLEISFEIQENLVSILAKLIGNPEKKQDKAVNEIHFDELDDTGEEFEYYLDRLTFVRS